MPSTRNRPLMQAAVPFLAALLLLQAGAAQEPVRAEQLHRRVDFATHIAPILEQRCQACHGAALRSGGLRLDSREAALKGGYSGPVIVAGKSAESRLILLVSGAGGNLVMPPTGERLPPAEIELLRAWVDQGAEWPEGSAAAAAPETDTLPWAFQPVSKPEVPSVRAEEWLRNPIDGFILARLEEEGIDPSAPARPEILARRVAPRPHGPAAAPRRSRSIPRCPRPRGVRAVGGSPARVPALRRALGHSLA